MIETGLGLIGGALAVGGACALTGVKLSKRKTHPGIAVAMILVGLATLYVAFFGLPRF